MTHVTSLAQDLRLICADNPSPMTGEGTNSYILGRKQVCVIDPGPNDPTHLARLLDAIGPDRVACILVTHSHKDHSPLAPLLGQATGAPVLAFGDSRAGQSEVMQALAAQGISGGGEGVDPDFKPDLCLRDNEVVAFGDHRLIALWTPGHMGNHMCFQWGDVVFTGDHVMGWAPSLVSPPDGDMSAYMASLARLTKINARVMYAGHGAAIEHPQSRVAELLAHRNARETAILAELAPGPATIPALTDRIYTDLAPTLHKAAARNVFAHLVDLHTRGRVSANQGLHPLAEFTLSQS
ncbi:MAG: MBL fold metallo-hydrolase [Rhodobacteraceae bacterium]|nr:MBL fold metallo-hydrolase [Paracoccaceae bacterium]